MAGIRIARIYQELFRGPQVTIETDTPNDWRHLLPFLRAFRPHYEFTASEDKKAFHVLPPCCLRLPLEFVARDILFLLREFHFIRPKDFCERSFRHPFQVYTARRSHR